VRGEGSISEGIRGDREAIEEARVKVLGLGEGVV
jgi:hypothetical protein